MQTSSTSSLGAGNGDDVLVTVGNLSIADNGQIQSVALDSGKWRRRFGQRVSFKPPRKRCRAT
jgi:hypothetical protein